MKSWRKYFPDYEIKEWNEDDFDVNSIPYTRDAYAMGKYAFVSDYARFWILYRYGGLYFDTDVEIIGDMSDVLARGAFWGMEYCKDHTVAVNPGQGMGAEPGLPFYRTVLDRYATMPFLNDDGTRNCYSMVPMVSDMLVDAGLKAIPDIQPVAGTTVYPPDYFNPFDEITGRLNKTANTRSIHWYSMSWFSPRERFKMKIKRWIRHVIGVRVINHLKA